MVRRARPTGVVDHGASTAADARTWWENHRRSAAPTPSELATFARWLVAMDDPNDTDGMRARQTVTLTSIIAQARAALAADGGEA